MARGASNESTLGKLHSRLTEVFLRVLSRYEDRLAMADRINSGEVNIEDEMIAELFNDNSMPNPAMLSAVSKFLKDNEITFDTEQLNELSGLERRLKDMQSKRGNVVSLTNLPRVADA